jgi:hypothetical protein
VTAVLELLAIAGVIQLVLAGLSVGGPRYRPEWMGLACLAFAAMWPTIRLLAAT